MERRKKRRNVQNRKKKEKNKINLRELQQQASLNKSWEEHRSMTFKALLQATFAVPKDIMCQRCMHKTAVVKCNMCSSTQHLCHECDEILHESWPFHDRDAIANGHY